MTRSRLALTIGFAAEAVRETGPLVHCVAPRAATSFVADVLHGVGARSVITGGSAAALAAAASADAVSLDLSSLGSEWSDAALPAVGGVREAGIPWLLDVTRLGRVPLDADRLRSLLGQAPAIVRADAAEVDGVALDDGSRVLALGESCERVLAPGTDVAVPVGDAMLGQVPGVRSAVSALMAACAVVTAPAEAALAGAAWLAVASERAGEQARGPASFRSALVDALWTVRGDEIAEYLELG